MEVARNLNPSTRAEEKTKEILNKIDEELFKEA